VSNKLFSIDEASVKCLFLDVCDFWCSFVTCSSRATYIMYIHWKYIIVVHSPGDFRMVFGEDKRKVLNIVQANIPEFEKLYSSFLPDLVEFLPDDQMIRVSVYWDKCTRIN